MIFHRTRRFRKQFRKLPQHVQEKSARIFRLLQENSRHPSLGVKKVQGVEGVWEGRIDAFWRFTFELARDPQTDDQVCLLRNIGPHDVIKKAP